MTAVPPGHLLLLDTTVVICYLRGIAGSRPLLFWAGEPGVPMLSTVTHLEVYQGMKPKEEERTEAFFSAFVAEPLTQEVARQAGAILRTLRGRGKTIDFADAVIAASAMKAGRAVLTLNAGHFRRIDGLEVVDAAPVLAEFDRQEAQPPR